MRHTISIGLALFASAIAGCQDGVLFVGVASEVRSDLARRDGPSRDEPASDAPGFDAKDATEMPPVDGPVAPPRDSQSAPRDGALPPPDVAAGGALPDPPYAGTFPTGSGAMQATLTILGTARTMEIYRPSGVANPALVVYFHATGTSGSNIISAVPPSFLQQHGVVAIAPDARFIGVRDWDHDSGDVYWQTYPNVDPTSNPDLILVRAIIAEAAARYNVDRRRVYTDGHSSGAFFSMLAAMALNDQIAAFGEVSGGLVRCSNTRDCYFQTSASGCGAIRNGCACAGPEKPGPVTSSGRKPPGYLVHNSGDDVVSSYYTCALSERMNQLGFTSNLRIINNLGHDPPANYHQDAYLWMRQFSAP